MKNNQTTHTLIIDDLETIKVIADPLRSQLLELLIVDSLMVKQMAQELGLALSKLYYHVNLLEKHILIQVVETRVVANMIEKLYTATAPHFEVDPELLRFSTPEGKEHINAIITSTIDVTLEDLQRSLEARAFELDLGAPEQPRKVVINRLLSRLSKEQAEHFQAHLCELVEDFEQADSDSPQPGGDVQTYAMTVALYPSFYFKDLDDNKDNS